MIAARRQISGPTNERPRPLAASLGEHFMHVVQSGRDDGGMNQGFTQNGWSSDIMLTGGHPCKSNRVYPRVPPQGQRADSTVSLGLFFLYTKGLLACCL